MLEIFLCWSCVAHFLQLKLWSLNIKVHIWPCLWNWSNQHKAAHILCVNSSISLQCRISLLEIKGHRSYDTFISTTVFSIILCGRYFLASGYRCEYSLELTLHFIQSYNLHSIYIHRFLSKTVAVWVGLNVSILMHSVLCGCRHSVVVNTTVFKIIWTKCEL